MEKKSIGEIKPQFKNAFAETLDIFKNFGNQEIKKINLDWRPIYEDQKFKGLIFKSPKDKKELFQDKRFSEIAHLRYILNWLKGWGVDGQDADLEMDIDRYDIFDQAGQFTEHFALENKEKGGRIDAYARVIPPKGDFMIEKGGSFAKQMTDHLQRILQRLHAESMEISRFEAPKITEEHGNVKYSKSELDPKATIAMYAILSKYAIEKGIKNFFMVVDSNYAKILKRTFNAFPISETGDYKYDYDTDTRSFKIINKAHLQKLRRSIPEEDLRAFEANLSLTTMIHIPYTIGRLVTSRDNERIKLFLGGISKKVLKNYLEIPLKKIFTPTEINQLPESIRTEVDKYIDRMTKCYQLNQEDINWAYQILEQ